MLCVTVRSDNDARPAICGLATGEVRTLPCSCLPWLCWQPPPICVSRECRTLLLRPYRAQDTGKQKGMP